VDWWQWSDEAFAAAAERDVPVLLSVGYSACHWCHVMAHESFEDEQTAAIMNEHLVSIKVDREERPDVDSVYMTATQAMTGQGGWPMTCFMTPDREPFFCGTYFPRAQFQRLVLGVAQAWREDKAQVAAQARQIAAALAERAGQPASAAGRGDASDDAATKDGATKDGATKDGANQHAANRDGAGRGGADSPLTSAGVTLGVLEADGAEPDGKEPAEALAAAAEAAVDVLAEEFDASRGGFGGAPKFPPSMVLEFLFRHFERADGPDAPRALEMAAATADAMARGGMYDQLAGGFARYSVDAGWVVPHFEKMLYDNALLARVYAHLWRRTGSLLARRVAEETCDWLIAEMRTPEGAFASALDADSDGVEGAFYVWTPDQLTTVLGPADGGYAAATFGVTETGTFEHGASVLQLRADPADTARFARIRARLLAARAQRTRPARDDKVVAAWNGLAISALADVGTLLDRPDLREAATAAAGLVADVHVSDGRLARTSRDGHSSGTAGVLDDYGCVAAGFIALAGAVGGDDPGAGRWLALAGQLLDTVLARFGTGTGGFFDTADDSERLIYRPADVADGPSPSGTFAVADALLSYSALTGSRHYREAAVDALAGVPALATRFPRAAGSGLAVAEAVLSGPAEIAVVGPAGAARAELHRVAALAAPPGAVIAVGDADQPDASTATTGAAGAAGRPGLASEQIPLLAGRTAVDGRPAAYVCRDFSCRTPVTQPEQLRAALS
jgi:uncharacterized protein YyaL (SSP411 family)